MPAAATSAVSRCRAGDCIPRLTQWLAVTANSNPLAVRKRRDRRARRRSSSVSSVCKSTPTPWSAAMARNVSVAARASPSRWGQPPTRSAPAPRASRRSARWSAPAVPVIGRAEGDDLNVDDIGGATADFDQRLDAAQSVLQCRVGVRARLGSRCTPSAGRLARRGSVVSSTSSSARQRALPRSRRGGRRTGWPRSAKALSRCAARRLPTAGGDRRDRARRHRSGARRRRRR